MPSYEYPRPALTVDAVVFRDGPDGREVLLIRRGNEPFLGMWALPGGFIDELEAPLAAVRRELAEETGIVHEGPYYHVGIFGEPGRDPRGWVVTGAFATELPEGAPEPVAADDATDARWHPLAALPELAADHESIIREAQQRLACELEPWTALRARGGDS